MERTRKVQIKLAVTGNHGAVLRATLTPAGRNSLAHTTIEHSLEITPAMLRAMADAIEAEEGSHV